MEEYKCLPVTKSGIRVRDNVHGDIFIPEKFVPIVDTYAFQRLRRVKQLSTAQYAFPAADHTRFIHSLGTFHVMQQIIAHFESYFMELGLSDKIDEREKDLLLAASLLHDLGHTPFSHALEDVMPNAKKVPHEKWTYDIIVEEKEELYDIIEDLLGKGSASEIASLILSQNSDPFFPADNINLRNIFHSLISSQLDADRLDYLRRDSMSTGFSYGLVDIDRLISGLRIGIREDGKAVVCVAEKTLPDVEGYLYARYQMYRNVYYKPYKMLTEELLKKVIRQVYDLFEHDKLKITELPLGFKAALQNPSMGVDDYLSLDDYVIMGAIKEWSELKGKYTKVLSNLCQCLLYRKGYIRYKFVDLLPKTIQFFKEELVMVIKKYMAENAKEEYRNMDLDSWIDMFPFIVFRIAYPKLYNDKKDNIYIMENSGRLVEISHCSNLVHAYISSDEAEQEEPTLAVSAIYYNPNMLKIYLKENPDFEITDEKIEEIQKEVKILLERNQAKNCIEIEKKYHVPNEKDWNDVLNKLPAFFKNNGYSDTTKSGKDSSEEPKVVRQTDYYLDTPDELLFTKNCTLRIRFKGEKAEITCKKPVRESCSNGRQGQVERYEYVSVLKEADLTNKADLYKCDECKNFVEKYLQDEVAFEDLEYRIIVINDRIKYLFKKGTENSEQFHTEEIYELALDAVTYQNCKNENKHNEYQIEIELKSEAITRLNMLYLTNRIEQEYPEWALEVMSDSKYVRAKNFTL